MSTRARTRISENRVRLFMVKRGISEQKELAQKAGLAEQTLVRILKGGRFSSATLDKIAQALGVNPIDILLTEGHPDPHMDAPTSAD